jgi:predicted nucleotide-binding protein (sugar kinase/HSP70/actin superfamily)
MAEDGELPPGARALMAGSFGPCRLGKYAQEQQRILDERGIALAILTTVSNNAYGDLGLGQAFELLSWQGMVATDHLQKLLWMVRPYERQPGEANRAYTHYLARLAQATRARQPLGALLREAVATLLELRDPALPRRPLIGINGEIYLRANRFCNQDVVGLCEANGLEVEVSPLSEWFRYTALRNVEDGWANRDPSRLVKGGLRRLAMAFYGRRVAAWFAAALAEPEHGPQQLLAASGRYLPSRNGSEAVLSLGSGVLQLQDPHFAGVISVMPHGCMPGGIVAAFAEQISSAHGFKPWVSLTYDGFADKVNAERIADLAEQVRHRA